MLNQLGQHLTPLRIAALYAFFASLWILFSDSLLALLVDNPRLLAQFSLVKGLFYVGITTLLLWLLLQVWEQRAAPTLSSLTPGEAKRRHLPWLVLLTFLLVPLLGVSVVVLHKPAMEQEAQASLEAIATLKAKHLSGWLEERLGDGLVFVENQVFADRVSDWREEGDPRIARHLVERMESVRRAYGARGFESVFLVDPLGKPLLNADSHAILPEQALTLLERATEQGRTLYSPIYQDYLGTWHLDIIVPLFDSNGHSPGAVVMHVDPTAHLYSILAEWPGTSTASCCYLLQREGSMLRVLPPSKTLDIERTELHRPLPAVPMGPGRTEGEPRMGAWAQVGENDWFVLVTIPSSEVFQDLYALVAWVVLISFFAALLITAVLTLLWRYHRRLDQLALQAQAAEMGHMLQYFYDQPLIGMAVLSTPQRRWLRANRQLSETLGYDFDALQQTDWSSLIAPADRDAEEKEHRYILNGWSDGYQRELRFTHASGEVVDMQVNLQAVREEDGRISFYITTLQDVSERKQHERLLQRQRDLYNVISHTNQAIVRSKTREELFQEICNIAIDYGHFRFATLMHHQRDQDRLETLAACGQDPTLATMPQFHPLALNEEGPVQELFRHGRTVVINHVEQHGELPGWQTQARQSGVASLALLPIRRHGEIYGALGLYATEAEYFDDAILQTLHEMAMDVGFALENFERTRALETASHVVEASPVVLFRWLAEEGWPVQYVSENVRRWGYSADSLLRNELRYEEMVHPDDRKWLHSDVDHHTRHNINSYQQFYRLLHADGRVMWVEDKTTIERDDEGKAIAYNGVVTDITERQEAEERFRALVEQSLVGIFMLRGRKVYYANPRAEAIYGYPEGASHGKAVKDFIARSDQPRVLEQITDVVTGRLERAQFQFEGRHHDGHSIMIGAHITRTTIDGQAMLIGVLQDITEKLHTEQKIKAYTHQLEKAMEGTVQAISYMVELRDPYTSGHERRVGEIAAAIAAEMGQDEGFQRAIQLIGGLHDVGKITVPAEILSKPGRLSAIEYEIIKAHAEQGYEILKSIQFPWPVAEAVRQHHERIDGSGYPSGLKGEAIILEARIISVADVIESMASHRPYRPGIGIDVALEEIERGAGSAYDPDVTAACLRLFREKGYEIPA